MDTYTDKKPKIGTGSEFDQTGRGSLRPEVNVTQSNKGSNATIAYIIAAIVVIVGAYLLYTNEWSTATVAPTITQNNTTTPPAPDATNPATPVPATPPASDTTTPPATGTAPQPPVAPAQ